MMLRAKALQAMNSEQKRASLKQVLDVALEKLLRRDLDLIISGAHEQSICHRLAVYLEKAIDLNVDCEYNRNMTKAKELEGGIRFRPDIIVHRRLSNDENALVIETKARAQHSVSDVRKLRELTADLGAYRYWAGAFIVLFNESMTVLQSGVLRLTVDWFPQLPREERVEIIRPIPRLLLRRISHMTFI